MTPRPFTGPVVLRRGRGCPRAALARLRASPTAVEAVPMQRCAGSAAPEQPRPLLAQIRNLLGRRWGRCPSELYETRA